MEEILDKIYGYLTQYGLSVLAAVVILLVGKRMACSYPF